MQHAPLHHVEGDPYSSQPSEDHYQDQLQGQPEDQAEPVAHESGAVEEPAAQESPPEFQSDEDQSEPVDAIDLPLDDDSKNPDRLVPVLTFSGAPAHRIIKKFQVKPDPGSVPRITRESIQGNPSLTVRQKGYLSKVLDDYYRFIVSNVKSLRRRHFKKK